MTLSTNLKRYAVLTMIVGGVVLALSGLCTGVLIASGPDGYVPNALGVLGIGMIGMLPGAILFFSARWIMKKGPSLLPGILIILVSTPILILLVFGIISIVMSIGAPLPSFFISLLFYLGLALLALAMTIFGFKTITRARQKPPEADIF